MELLRLEALSPAAAGLSLEGALDEISGLEDELVARALGVAGRAQPAGVHTILPGPAMRRLDDCELRARRLATGPVNGALDFLGDAFAVLACDNLLPALGARKAVTRVAADLDISPAKAALIVYRRAISSQYFVGLPPEFAADLIVSLLVALGPAGSVSLWAADESGKLRCHAAAGRSPRSRRLRQVAQGALDGVVAASTRFQSLVVDRWDRPFAALVAHALPGDTSQLRWFLSEAVGALSPVLERDAVFERNEASERVIVSAGERRLARLGFDLHDGPLQEIVALADDLRHAREQVTPLLDGIRRARVAGRFDDLEARLAALDSGIREIAHSVRPTTAVERPLAHALRGEIEALSRTSDIETNFRADGDLDTLTDSQRIVVFRVVQEALANVRKHSGARCVSVRVSGTERLLTVDVSDDGCGFDAADVAGSDRLGLAGVSERVRLLGGDVEIESRPGLGTIVRATLVRWRPSTVSSGPIYAVTT